jgi:hypothetical protein
MGVRTRRVVGPWLACVLGIQALRNEGVVWVKRRVGESMQLLGLLQLRIDAKIKIVVVAAKDGWIKFV